LKRLYVRPEFRGRGVGRTLVTTLVDAAREMGYRWVQVHTAEFLPEALQLYRGLASGRCHPRRMTKR
jgi:GNAT superfamily N-acetyltransferase